jgi:hypothetical protein
VHGRSSTAGELLLPCLHNEHIVDGDDVDVLNTFLGELGVVTDVAGDVRGARG